MLDKAFYIETELPLHAIPNLTNEDVDRADEKVVGHQLGRFVICF